MRSKASRRAQHTRKRLPEIVIEVASWLKLLPVLVASCHGSSHSQTAAQPAIGFDLCYEEECSYAETAVELGLSVKAVGPLFGAREAEAAAGIDRFGKKNFQLSEAFLSLVCIKR